MEQPKRKNPRLKNFDYSSIGSYFITICTEGRRGILCEIVGRDDLGTPCYVTQLTEKGKIADKYINQISQNYPNVCVDNYVIMPDHIHLLLSITEKRRAESSRPTTISQIVAILKRLINKEAGSNLFQSSFNDHIIRDEIDYKTKWDYIETNPLKWVKKRTSERKNKYENRKRI